MGGIYEVGKYKLSPESCPRRFTGLSGGLLDLLTGMVLLSVIYYLGGRIVSH